VSRPKVYSLWQTDYSMSPSLGVGQGPTHHP
jgi:hypothetical protein